MVVVLGRAVLEPADAERLIRDYLARAGYPGRAVVAVDLRWLHDRWVARCTIPKRRHTVDVEVRAPNTMFEYDEGPWVVRSRQMIYSATWPPADSLSPGDLARRRQRRR